MYTLMRDPVLLPSSRTVIDRATIKSHLLSDAKDPFNRMPLSLEDVVPGAFHSCHLRLGSKCVYSVHADLDLKARIEAFLAERRNKNTAFDKPAEDVVDM